MTSLTPFLLTSGTTAMLAGTLPRLSTSSCRTSYCVTLLPHLSSSSSWQWQAHQMAELAYLQLQQKLVQVQWMGTLSLLPLINLLANTRHLVNLWIASPFSKAWLPQPSLSVPTIPRSKTSCSTVTQPTIFYSTTFIWSSSFSPSLCFSSSAFSKYINPVRLALQAFTTCSQSHDSHLQLSLKQ